MNYSKEVHFIENNTFKFCCKFLLLLVPLASFSQSQMVAGGNGHSIVLQKNGHVYCLGRNNYGQIGDSTFENRLYPTLVKGLPKIKFIARGYDHSIAIDAQGRIYTWGRNNYGQLGTNLPLDFPFPQKLQNHQDFVQAAGGHWHTVALKKDGSVWSWGHNFFGELGNGTREHSAMPVSVLIENGNRLTGIQSIVSVGYHTLALDSSGHVYGWGANDYGQLGIPNKNVVSFATLIPNLSHISSVAVGWHHSVALDDQGILHLWGSDPSQQNREKVGYFNYTIKRLAEGYPKFRTIVCGSWHSLAIDEKGRLWGWGKNQYGMLGTGDTISKSAPVLLPTQKGICTIGAGCFQSLMVDSTGQIWTMGDNPSGQQGQGNLLRLHSPQLIVFSSNSNVLNPQDFKNRHVLLLSLMLLVSLILNGICMIKLRKANRKAINI